MNTIKGVVKRLEAGAADAKSSPDPQQQEQVAVEPRERSADTSTTLNMVEVDIEGLKARCMLYPSAPKSSLSEEFRQMKRPLLANVDGRCAAPIPKSNFIVVTSSMPDEGKSFIAVNLAISLALEVDRTVLLVDADVEASSVSRILGVEERPGLIDFLSDNSLTVQDILLRTNIPNLRLIQSGALNPYSTELLSCERMRSFSDELAKRYKNRIIVFDSPPLIATSQSRVLAELGGQILVVVEAGRTSRRVVQTAIADLDRTKAISLILNKQPAIIADTGFAYGSYSRD